MQKAKLSLTYFLKYYKYIPSLLFWVLWTCLTTPTKNDSINVETNGNFNLQKKDQLHTFFFIEILHFLHFKES